MPERASDRITLVDVDAHPRRSVADRFPAAATSAPPKPEQVEKVRRLQSCVRGLALLIDFEVPEGADKDLALTHLEDVLMRANRGVFTGPVEVEVRG